MILLTLILIFTFFAAANFTLFVGRGYDLCFSHQSLSRVDLEREP